MLVHVSTPYEEAFIRRNAVLKFQQRFSILFHLIISILRSAQIHHASLKPAYPGSVSFCTCGYAFRRNCYIEMQHIWNTVHFMTFMMMRKNVCSSFIL